MTGRRVYPDPRTGELLLRAGDYGQAQDGMWHAKPPTADAILIHLEHVEELPNSTISVSFTISAQDDAGSYWTGNLIQGEWIQR